MRIKTFLAAYLLFLCMLFSIISVVSIYMTNSQMRMLKERSAREYQTLMTSLTRDITVIYDRNEIFPNIDLVESINTLVSGYARFYNRHHINIALTDLRLLEREAINPHDREISFVQRDLGHAIHITGLLPAPLLAYQLDAYFDISDSIVEMQNIQHTLLMLSIIFAIITALGLHFILLRIFKPLQIVANTSKKIASGQYHERIMIKGKNELASMAFYFNQMAEEIEKQIHLLGKELEEKQQFVDNFAHEIRTPLTSIYGYAEYIQRAPLEGEEIIESAGYIIDESAHMEKIANSLLELATLRNFTPVKSKISTNDLFEEVRQTMKKNLNEHKIQLLLHVAVDFLEGQEDLLKSLLLNLCFNACKACTPGEGIIRLEALEQEGKTIISVSDNGCGIPEDGLSKVTEPFYRLDASRSRDQGGAGLGLTLCRQIVEVHRAKMVVESSLGLGTTIKIIFDN